MKLYKSPNGEIFAYEEDGSQDALIPSNFVALTQTEIDARNKENDLLLCKAKAMGLLAASDWTQLPDVGLKNVADFVTYRGILRGLATQPQVNPDFPVEPTPVWE